MVWLQALLASLEMICGLQNGMDEEKFEIIRRSFSGGRSGLMKGCF
jgi:hypothetical protein